MVGCWLIGLCVPSVHERISTAEALPDAPLFRFDANQDGTINE